MPTPKFEAGKKVFRLTSSSTNSQSATDVGTDASQVFDASGSIETVQSTIISVRNINTHTQIQTESRSSTSGGGSTYTTTDTQQIGSDSQDYTPPQTQHWQQVYTAPGVVAQVTQTASGTEIIYANEYGKETVNSDEVIEQQNLKRQNTQDKRKVVMHIIKIRIDISFIKKIYMVFFKSNH